LTLLRLYVRGHDLSVYGANIAFFLRIPGDLPAWLGALGYVLLVFAPGAWITFGLALDGIPFWARLFTGAALSPLIVCVEFYAIRLVGIPFELTAVLLVILNLPAIYFVWKRRIKVVPLHRSDWLVGAAAVVIPIVCMIPVLIHMDERIHSPHSWLHADAVYMFARGDLVLEDPTLAGIRLAYPVWSALVFQAVHSFLVNSPPVSCFVWNNLLLLIVVYGFVAGITKEMGGHKLAQLSSGIWLLLGANPVGWILMKLAPGGMSHELWGDMRYTPWVSKFLVFSPMPLAIGMMMAMIYLLVRAGPLTKQVLAVICLLFSGIGLLYPLLLPPACGLIGARAIAILPARQNRRWSIPYREWLALAGLLLVAILVTYSEIRFLTSDRHVATSPIFLSAIPSAARKIFESLVATSLFVAGLAFTFRTCWKSKRTATVFLLAGALASYILYAAFNIPYYENEYKFIFAVVMCLAVFPAIAVERIWREWPRTKAVPVLTATALLVLATYAHWTYAHWPSPWSERTSGSPRPELKYDAQLKTGEFYLQLDPKQTWSGVCSAVRRLTPADSILILNNGAFYYPVFTGRSLYVSALNRIYAGVNHRADDLDADLRGYGWEILAQRRATLADLFNATDSSRRERALAALLALKRPVAIIAEPQHSGLLEWLKQRETASQLYAENGLSLWFIKPAKITDR
jgi:hypothetical protein